jgi:uncharacterized membrane protein (DUF485 family)
MEEKNNNTGSNSELNKNKKYHDATNAFFYASIAQIPLFALPAICGVILGKYLDKKFATGMTFTLVILCITFITSWVFVFRMNKRITDRYKEIRRKMQEEGN